MPEILLRALRDLRRGFAWWSLGLVALAAMMVSVYPTIRDDPGLSDLAERYPDVLKELFGFGGADFDYSSAAGYLGIELFSLTVPLLLIIAAVATGAGAIAGEEERGTLDLLMALPVARRRVVAERLGAMAIEVAALALVLLIALGVGIRVIDMEISLHRVGAAALAAALLAVGFGAIALAIGAATGSRGAAIGLAAALAVGGYLVDSLAGLVPALEGPRTLTPFYHYSAPDTLREGLAWPHVGALVLVIAVASVAALVAIDRRDLR